MHKYYKKYFDITSHHKKRQKNDMQPEFSYVNWLRLVIQVFSLYLYRINYTKYLLREAPKSAHVQINSENYKYEFGDTSGKPIAYISYYNDMKRNRPALDKQIKSKNTKVYLYFI